MDANLIGYYIMWMSKSKYANQKRKERKEKKKVMLTGKLYVFVDIIFILDFKKITLEKSLTEQGKQATEILRNNNLNSTSRSKHNLTVEVKPNRNYV